MSQGRDLRQSLRRHAQLAAFAARRLGPAGLAGALLILAALGARAGFGFVAERNAEQARAEAAQLRARLARPEQSATPADRIAAFFDALVLPADGADSRQPAPVIHRLARKHGLRLERGDYQAIPDARGRVVRHQMTIPLQASYPQLRGWLAEVLATLPGAAIDGLILKRESAAEDELEVQVRLAVYLKAPAAPAGPPARTADARTGPVPALASRSERGAGS